MKMDTIIEILEEMHPGVDYRTCTTLIDEHYLDSLDMISLVGELEDEYDIRIQAVEINPSNFNSAESIWALVKRLLAEDQA